MVTGSGPETGLAADTVKVPLEEFAAIATLLVSPAALLDSNALQDPGAGNEFHIEAVAFVAIVITAAIPILNNLRALAYFLRAISNL